MKKIALLLALLLTLTACKIQEDQNTLISPLSIISALSMTANGAEKETLAQMEEAFLCGIIT